MALKVLVERVLVGGFAGDPMPTLAIGWGTTDDGTVMVAFAGDVRVMVELGEAMQAAGEPQWADVEDWQVLGVREVGSGE